MNVRVIIHLFNFSLLIFIFNIVIFDVQTCPLSVSFLLSSSSFNKLPRIRNNKGSLVFVKRCSGLLRLISVSNLGSDLSKTIGFLLSCLLSPLDLVWIRAKLLIQSSEDFCRIFFLVWSIDVHQFNVTLFVKHQLNVSDE